MLTSSSELFYKFKLGEELRGFAYQHERDMLPFFFFFFLVVAASLKVPGHFYSHFYKKNKLRFMFYNQYFAYKMQ